jgi:hypothetical protein
LSRDICPGFRLTYTRAPFLMMFSMTSAK